MQVLIYYLKFEVSDDHQQEDSYAPLEQGSLCIPIVLGAYKGTQNNPHHEKFFCESFLPTKSSLGLAGIL